MKCEALIEELQPLLLIGSPVSQVLNQLIHLNRGHFSKETWADLEAQLEEHLQFFVRIYHKQQDAGRWWCHEHPSEAWSDDSASVKSLLSQKDTRLVSPEDCSYKLIVVDLNNEGELVLKPAGWLTNSERLVECFTEFPERNSKPWERRQFLSVNPGDLNPKAVSYPTDFFSSVLRAVCLELHSRGQLNRGEVGMVDAEEIEPDWQTYWNEHQQHQVEHSHAVNVVYDAISGVALPGKLVEEAKEEELRQIRSFKVYMKVPIQQCWDETGKGPIGVTWVVTNKGDDQNMDIRARLCAQDFKVKDPFRVDLFAPTPPYEGIRLLVSLTLTADEHNRFDINDIVFQILDATRAHFHSPSQRRTFVSLCNEDYEPGMCALLLQSMYGQRDAAANWEDFSFEVIVKVGFEGGVGSPCLAYHQKAKVRLFKHGDDFILGGPRAAVKQVTADLSKHIALKDKGRLGWCPCLGDISEARVLNRIMRAGYDERSVPMIEIEPDPRHVEIILSTLGLTTGSKTRMTPGEQDKGMMDLTDVEPEDVRVYRSAVMRGNFLAEDRYDIKYTVKELARDMQKPTVRSWTRLKHLGRYLLYRPRVCLRIRQQHYTKKLTAYSDSDWAACLLTRKSTSAGVIMHGINYIKGYSSTQADPATSSGEAEYYAGVKAASVALGVVGFAHDLGSTLECHLGLDSTAAIGLMRRSGLGKSRHVALPLLWLQNAVRKGRVHVFKEKGTSNIADAGTKYLAGPRLWELMLAMGFVSSRGHSDIAFKAQLR